MSASRVCAAWRVKHRRTAIHLLLCGALAAIAEGEAATLGATSSTKAPTAAAAFSSASLALSIVRNGPKSLKGRTLGVLVIDGADAELLGIAPNEHRARPCQRYRERPRPEENAQGGRAGPLGYRRPSPIAMQARISGLSTLLNSKVKASLMWVCSTGV
jgi:hypothetical protein